MSMKAFVLSSQRMATRDRSRASDWRTKIPARAHCLFLSHHRNRSPLSSMTVISTHIHKVAIVGSGNWGSAISRIVGSNVVKDPRFDRQVRMWVFEERVDGRPLPKIINEQHENVKYLPGYKIPTNVIADPDLCSTVRGADILLFVVPHQFLDSILKQIKDVVKPSAIGISLIKGLMFKDAESELISQHIKRALGLRCMGVLMGGNVAGDVASESFCETTLALDDMQDAHLLRSIFHTPHFRVDVINDVAGAELSGALKNVVALGAGFCDGLDFPPSTKAAIIRVGFNELRSFCKLLYPTVNDATFLHSCGIGDVIATCYGGRNRRCAEAFARAKGAVDWDELEAQLLGGQKLQGVLTANEVMACIRQHEAEQKFPLLVQIYGIVNRQLPVESIVEFDEEPLSPTLRSGL